KHREQGQTAEQLRRALQGSPPTVPWSRLRRVPSGRRNRLPRARSWCWVSAVVRRSGKAVCSSPPPNQHKLRLRVARHRPVGFFYGRAGPSLAEPLPNGVELQSKVLGDLCRNGAARKTPLDVTHHIIDQHCRSARHTRSVEPLRALIAVGLHRPLHADRCHPKGTDDVALLDVATDAELA